MHYSVIVYSLFSIFVEALSENRSRALSFPIAAALPHLPTGLRISPMVLRLEHQQLRSLAVHRA